VIFNMICAATQIAKPQSTVEVKSYLERADEASDFTCKVSFKLRNDFDLDKLFKFRSLSNLCSRSNLSVSRRVIRTMGGTLLLEGSLHGKYSLVCQVPCRNLEKMPSNHLTLMSDSTE